MSALRAFIVAASVCLTYANIATVAQAKDAKSSKILPNCEVKNNKRVHLKDKAACDKQKGTWLIAEAAPSPDTSTPAPASTATPAAATEQK